MGRSNPPVPVLGLIAAGLGFVGALIATEAIRRRGRRVYDRENGVYRRWTAIEGQIYREWLASKRLSERPFKRLERSLQNEYWRWREQRRVQQ